MRQHDTRIMRRATSTCVCHRRRKTACETDPIRDLSDQQRTRMNGHTLAVTGHLHPPRGTCNVHLGSALLVAVLLASTPAVSPTRRAFSRTRPNDQRPATEISGLAQMPEAGGDEGQYRCVEILESLAERATSEEAGMDAFGDHGQLEEAQCDVEGEIVRSQ